MAKRGWGHNLFFVVVEGWVFFDGFLDFGDAVVWVGSWCGILGHVA